MEVLLALGITAMIGATVTAMLFAVSHGTEERHDLRRQNVRTQVVGHRLDTTIRSASRVLAVEDHFVVLWMGDIRRNERPDLSELRRIEWDESSRVLRAYAAPTDLPEVDDVAYELTADFAAITEALRETDRFAGETWADRVLEWRIGSDADARMLRYTLTLQGQDRPAELHSTITLRGR